ncbi:MAG: ABC transporter substrate-binding protein [Bacillota bacterium]|nr:ABC transporter substrate-binding protein [Bacillota bacterium]
MNIIKITEIIIFSVIMVFMVGCTDTNNKESVQVQEEISSSITIVDCANREVVLEKKAERIIDLTYLEGVRTLIELNADHLLVGMSANDHHGFILGGPLKDVYKTAINSSPQLNELPNVGSYKEPNIEKIISLKPDLILVMPNQKEQANTLSKQLNIPVICVGGNGTFNLEMFNIVGKAIGKEDRANELIEFTNGKIEKVRNITDKISMEDKKSIFYLVRTLGDPVTNGRYEGFDIAGAVNVANQGESTPYDKYAITKEQIVEWNPDIILKQTPTTKDVEGYHTMETIKNDPIFKTIKAVKNNQIYSVKGQMRGYDIANELAEIFYVAKLLYPNEFQELDVEKEGNEILKKFYNVDGLYTKMSNAIGLYEWE